MKVKWDDFKKWIRDSGIIINIRELKFNVYDNSVLNLLERTLDEKKIHILNDSLFNAPTFDLSHEENLDSFQTFETALK